MAKFQIINGHLKDLREHSIEPLFREDIKFIGKLCTVCHSMKLLYYRDLIDIGFSPEQVKAIASEYTVIDGPDDEGSMFERAAKPFG